MKEEQIISRRPEVMNGALVFVGTRVPVEILIQHLVAGDSLDKFLDDFPTVSREQAVGYLKMTLEVADARAAWWELTSQTEATFLRWHRSCHSWLSGLERKENGELLIVAENEFDAFITMDQGIPHQHDLNKMKMGIVLLEARSNRYEDLEPLMNQVNVVLKTLKNGQVVRVGS